MDKATGKPKSGKTPANWNILLRCFSFLRPYWRLTAASYAFFFVINSLTLLVPQFIRLIVDRGIRQGNLRFIGWAALGLLGLVLLKGILTFFQGRWTEMASQGVAYGIRNRIHAKLASLSFSYHDRTETGELLSRSIQDVERVRFLTGRALQRVLEGVFLLIGTAIVLLVTNPRLALLALISSPIVVVLAFSFGKRFRPLSLTIQQQLAVLTTRIEQNLRGARVVKAFGQEEEEIRRFDVENEKWFGLSRTASRLRATYIPLIRVLADMGIIFILWYGGRQVIQGEFTLGQLVAFTAYLSQLAVPIRRLGVTIAVIAQASSAGERILEILDARSEVTERPDATTLRRVEGRVQFENVSFSYFHRFQVLSNISFEVRPGQTIALLGTTGSGKSSIINLIPRFYDPTDGRILIDGTDIREVTLQSLRSQIGIVLQDTTLFAVTMRENIAFGAPGATDEEIVRAAKAAQAHPFIAELPDAYDTLVGEQGRTLSGGQKQRIAIARAILSDPRILILDDATASVDTETESLIQLALENLMVGRTSFVIAQRLSTVRKADLILVLHRGKIVARGTHEELIRTSGIYTEIYHRQLRSGSGNEGAPSETLRDPKASSDSESRSVRHGPNNGLEAES
ncbi:MAG TPA: ABC transporter ATP-binding protein [Spirochaetia bacterium]|nr:ABC transporter ATP-binding protein [Spirochaetia bacterium]